MVGAISLPTGRGPGGRKTPNHPRAHAAGLSGSQVDVLITTSLHAGYDALVPELGKRPIPIIAESLPVRNAVSTVAVDNYRAGREIGCWAGRYANQHFGGQAHVLDLTYHLANTRARSQGFLNGLRETAAAVAHVITLNPQSRYDTAYQLTHDALTAQGTINIIFAVNDITAWGAINACRDLGLDPDSVLVIPFGMEGDTLKDAVMAGAYCKAGVAMFPEIVGPVLVESAIAAYRHHPLPAKLDMPFAILTCDTLTDFYSRTQSGWQLNPDVTRNSLVAPLDINRDAPAVPGGTPQRVGFLVRFMEHEWYRNLMAAMDAYAGRLGIEIVVVDAEQTLREEVELRRREIARYAAQQVTAGDVILIDGGPIACYLAEELMNHHGITVVTNASPVFDILRQNPEVILVSTGGALRRSSGMLVGPTAEATLRSLRAATLFLMVTGISLEFGLSHTDISEVTIKQAMIRSAHR